MRQSKLFTKTRKEAPKDEVSKNAQLLIRGGYIYKEIAGSYAYLPLGLLVLRNIIQVVREEMNRVGGQELNMTTLQEKGPWEASGRWDDEVVDVWFKTKLKNDTELGLAFTHEEPLSRLMKNYVNSYRDLPFYVYQFQTKFRNEVRAKSGIMRGREFMMKDLYDFSRNEEEHLEFYERMKRAYMSVFERLGIGDKTYMTMSNGGSFSKYSFEFQTLSEAGEDVILYDEENKLAINKEDYSEEIFTDFGLNKEDFSFKEGKSIEVGDIYTLGEKYSRAMDLTYTDEKGEPRHVYMGSYGIGISRLMGAIVEVLSDEKGIVWPETVAPCLVHLVRLSDEDGVLSVADRIYEDLQKSGVTVLYDDRDDVSAGAKFADADLLGMPYRVVVSSRSLESGGVELKRRDEEEGGAVSVEDLLGRFR